VADRPYRLAEDDLQIRIQLAPMNAGKYPMSNGITRLEARFWGEPEKVKEALAHGEAFDAEQANEAALVTSAPDSIDWDDEVRMAVETRTTLSPDALTGMEANLRFVGPETMETKIFGRLTAWQNWIFQRPNAVGPKGALTSYGTSDRAEFDFGRT